MMPDPLFYQLLLVGLVWLCLMLHVVWPYDCATAGPTTPRPAKAPPKRSSDPKPFPGLTHKPHCEACAQAAVLRPQAPCAPPPRIVSTRGRPRQVDTSSHFCPQPPCAYRGWVGLGHISANGLPTICQPQFVNFLPHLHDWLTTNAAGIIAGAMTQHGHKNTQQSVANSA